MNAISHAATALLVRKRWPGLPLWLALLCVQLVEFAWVVLNLVGVESTSTAATVRSIADVHLDHMPYSHSVASTLLLAAAAWCWMAFVLRRRDWAAAAAVAIGSHLVLDVLVHVPDIEVLPWVSSLKIGTGLYGVPACALVVELAYGVWCWWVFRGSRALLAAIVGFNLLALTFYLPGVPGPETWLAGHPRWFAALILVHVVTALLAVGVLARPRRGDTQADDPGSSSTQARLRPSRLAR